MELLIAITIVGVFLGLALPSFSSFTANQRVKNAAFDLVSALTLARSEAIKRNADVQIAAAGTWANGWNVQTANGTLIRGWGPYSNLTLAESPAAAVTYASNGRLTGTTAPSFKITSSGSGVKTRCITVDLSGRPNSKEC